MSGIQQLVADGPLILAIPVAAAAGAVTFLSPCCLPLVPGYLSYITGMAGTGRAAGQGGAAGTGSAAEPGGAAGPGGASAASGAAAGDPGGDSAGGVAVGTRVQAPPDPARPRGRMLAGTLLFVFGFSLVFSTYGLALGGLSHLLHGQNRILIQVLGGLTILMGLLFAGVLDRFSFAGRVARPSVRPRAGLAGAPLLGVLFAVGWTPCIGPTLGTVLGLSATLGNPVRGAFLAFVYALGLGIPFLLVAFAFERTMGALQFARRNARLISRIGGALLVAVGVLEVTGVWSSSLIWLQTHWFHGYSTPL